MEKITNKTPIKYWGGKQQLAPKIIALLLDHKCYCEPFFGGGAVFFAKIQSKIEVINDLNDNMVNFYKVVKRHFSELKDEVDVTLYSEYQWNMAKKLWKEGGFEVPRAWAVFVLSWQSFSGNLGSSWAYSDQKNCAQQFDNMKRLFDEKYLRRLEHTQIFCRDAVEVIEDVQSDDTFYFIDPPYFNADMGHYDGYTIADFENLLKTLSTIKGKFLLTTYPSELLNEYTMKNGWKTIENRMHLSASNTVGRQKIEVFTLNYDPPALQMSLF